MINRGRLFIKLDKTDAFPYKNHIIPDSKIMALKLLFIHTVSHSPKHIKVLNSEDQQRNICVLFSDHF